ncbi:hypothetical protein ABT317_10415, partial [Streptomyces carpinensis]
QDGKDIGYARYYTYPSSGARLTFRNVRPAAAPEHIPAEGAVAVLWLPEHAPTNTGSYPILPSRGSDREGPA